MKLSSNLFSARQPVNNGSPRVSVRSKRGQKLTSKRYNKIDHGRDEWEEEEEDFLTQGLNPHFITKDTKNMNKSARIKIEKARKVVKEQGSVKQVNPVIGVSVMLYEDHEAWYEIERERHFPVEFY